LFTTLQVSACRSGPGSASPARRSRSPPGPRPTPLVENDALRGGVVPAGRPRTTPAIAGQCFVRPSVTARGGAAHATWTAAPIRPLPASDLPSPSRCPRRRGQKARPETRADGTSCPVVSRTRPAARPVASTPTRPCPPDRATPQPEWPARIADRGVPISDRWPGGNQSAAPRRSTRPSRGAAALRRWR